MKKIIILLLLIPIVSAGVNRLSMRYIADNYVEECAEYERLWVNVTQVCQWEHPEGYKVDFDGWYCSCEVFGYGGKYNMYSLDYCSDVNFTIGYYTELQPINGVCVKWMIVRYDEVKE